MDKDTSTQDIQHSSSDRGRAFLTLQAAQNGEQPPDVSDEEAAQIGDMFSNASSTVKRSRRKLAAQDVGSSHDGERQIWDTLGYPDIGSISADAFEERYRRQDIARAIISAPVETTWRERPVITDTDGEDDAPTTEFEKDIQKLVDGKHLHRGLLHCCEWGDRRSRIGEYGLLFLGFADGRKMDQPVNVEELSSISDLQYIIPISQTNIEEWDLKDTGDSRALSLDGTPIPEINKNDDEESDDESDPLTQEPGHPETYTVKFQEETADRGEPETVKKKVHHSRVIHIVESPETSELKHTPVLEPIYNRLMDYEKVIGASAEMFWSSADRKFFASANGQGTTPEDIARFDNQMWEMVNGMRTSVYGENMDLEVVDGQNVDPSGIIDVIIKAISAVTGIPKRKLMGSERGELASSMDQNTWFGKIMERQNQFAAPVILRPLIDRLVSFGIVTPASKGKYSINWPSLFELDQEEQSTVNKNEAQAAKAAEEAIALGAPREPLYERLEYDTDAIETDSQSSPPAEPDPESESDVEAQKQFDDIRSRTGMRGRTTS